MIPAKLQPEIEALYVRQQKDWPAFSDAVQALSQIQVKTLNVLDSSISVQNNPARIRSTAARIDSMSLAERPCFLCESNRPPEQQGLNVLEDKYVVLVNPFPVLPRHFTVVGKDHLPQDIATSLKDFLRLSVLLGEESTLIFNGAKAGASAPDHIHFQIIPSGKLPLFRALDSGVSRTSKSPALMSFAGSAYLLFTASDETVLLKEIMRVLGSMQQAGDFNLEYLNIMAGSMGNNIFVILVPRKKHRPGCFSAEEPAQVLVSPAAIELCGVWVLPRLEDFEKISPEIIEEVNREVCFSEEECRVLV